MYSTYAGKKNSLVKKDEMTVDTFVLKISMLLQKFVQKAHTRCVATDFRRHKPVLLTPSQSAKDITRSHHAKAYFCYSVFFLAMLWLI